METPKDLQPLLDHIDRLRQLHRSGITPVFGQVEGLFELADSVRDDLVMRERLDLKPSDGPVAQLGRVMSRLVLDLPAGARVTLGSEPLSQTT